MKKIDFYTLIRLNNNGIESNVGAVLVKGYTDGKFNYYRGRGGWFAIHPVALLSAGWTSPTLKAAVAAANHPDMLEKVQGYINRLSDERSQYLANCVQETKELFTQGDFSRDYRNKF